MAIIQVLMMRNRRPEDEDDVIGRISYYSEQLLERLQKINKDYYVVEVDTDYIIHFKSYVWEKEIEDIENQKEIRQRMLESVEWEIEQMRIKRKGYEDSNFMKKPWDDLQKKRQELI